MPESSDNLASIPRRVQKELDRPINIEVSLSSGTIIKAVTLTAILSVAGYTIGMAAWRATEKIRKEMQAGQDHRRPWHEATIDETLRRASPTLTEDDQKDGDREKA